MKFLRPVSIDLRPVVGLFQIPDPGLKQILLGYFDVNIRLTSKGVPNFDERDKNLNS